MFKGPAAERTIDRFKEVIHYVDNPEVKVFSEQIKIALELAGLRSESVSDVCYVMPMCCSATYRVLLTMVLCIISSLCPLLNTY